MAKFQIGDDVRVDMPKGVNKRGVVGVSVMFTTWPEARFDGAVGTVVEINPHGPRGIPLYLVDFRDHKNRVSIPWQAEWFRQEWIESVADRTSKPVATSGALVAPEGMQDTTLMGST